jgi:hypothetical protein
MFVVSQASDGGLTAEMQAQTGSISFQYHVAQCSHDDPPGCLHFAGVSLAGITGSGPQGCHLQSPGSGTPTVAVVDCPSKGVGSVTLKLRHGGNITTEIGGEAHHGEACSPVPVTVKGGDDVSLIAVNDGCAETVVCGTGFSVPEVDSNDTVQVCKSYLRNGQMEGKM